MKNMAISKVAIAALAIFAALNLNTEASAGHERGHARFKAMPVSCPELNAIDPDLDGSMTRGEALRAAKRKFRSLDVNRDRRLDRYELVNVMPPKAIAAADSIIRDGRIGIIEYLRFVKLAFKHANIDNNRNIGCDELLSKSGRPLLHLLK